jgi:hypothetical protein
MRCDSERRQSNQSQDIGRQNVSPAKHHTPAWLTLLRNVRLHVMKRLRTRIERPLDVLFGVGGNVAVGSSIARIVIVCIVIVCIVMNIGPD